MNAFNDVDSGAYMVRYFYGMKDGAIFFYNFLS